MKNFVKLTDANSKKGTLIRVAHCQSKTGKPWFKGVAQMGSEAFIVSGDGHPVVDLETEIMFVREGGFWNYVG